MLRFNTPCTPKEEKARQKGFIHELCRPLGNAKKMQNANLEVYFRSRKISRSPKPAKGNAQQKPGAHREFAYYNENKSAQS